MSTDLRIELLVDHPGTIPMLAKWEQVEWGHLMPDVTLDDLSAAFQRRANRDSVPLTVVGFIDDQLVGTASLVANDMSTHKQLSPWLGVVYVAPDHRRQGYGSELVEAIKVHAQNLNLESIYLFTPDQMPFYARLGWRVHETVAYRGEKVTIMVWNRSQLLS